MKLKQYGLCIFILSWQALLAQPAVSSAMHSAPAAWTLFTKTDSTNPIEIRAPGGSVTFDLSPAMTFGDLKEQIAKLQLVDIERDSPYRGRWVLIYNGKEVGENHNPLLPDQNSKPIVMLGAVFNQGQVNKARQAERGEQEHLKKVVAVQPAAVQPAVVPVVRPAPASWTLFAKTGSTNHVSVRGEGPHGAEVHFELSPAMTVGDLKQQIAGLIDIKPSNKVKPGEWTLSYGGRPVFDAILLSSLMDDLNFHPLIMLGADFNSERVNKAKQAERKGVL